MTSNTVSTSAHAPAEVPQRYLIETHRD